MSEAVHDYQSGDQDIAEQVSTFSAFGKTIKWGSLALAVLLVMLVLWFCVNAGFFGGLGPGILLAVIGVFALRSRAAPAH